MMRVVLLAIPTAFLATVPCHAQEFTDRAAVTSVRPLTEQVVTPVRECETEMQLVERPRERGVAGPIIGGIVGALAGSNIGGGSGKDVATAAGAIAGTIVGDRMQNNGAESYEVTRQPRETCRTVERSRTRNAGYDVTYEYRGRTFRTTMRSEPGEHINVKVRVTADSY